MMKSLSLLLLLAAICTLPLCHGCIIKLIGRKKKWEICKDFSSAGGSRCVLNTKEGEMGSRQANDLAIELYKSVATDRMVDQENMLLFPSEISRILSVLMMADVVEGSGQSNTPLKSYPNRQEALMLRHLKCHVNKFTDFMYYSNLLVLSKDEEKKKKSEQKRKHKQGRGSITIPLDSSTSKKIFSFNHHVFIDSKISIPDDYSKESYCTYQIPISSTDFSKGEEVAEVINKWAANANREAFKGIHARGNQEQDSFAVRGPVADNPEMIQNEKAVMISSMFLKMFWQDNMFNSKRTEVGQNFKVNKMMDQASGSSLSLPMMNAHGTFKTAEADVYKAVSLPTQADGSFIVILPNKGQTLEEVERRLVTNGLDMEAFITKLNKEGEFKELNIKLPRLTIQITHEWTSPSKKAMPVFANKSGHSIAANQVGIYQEAYLELTESEEGAVNATQQQQSSSTTVEKGTEFVVNRPFMFIMTQGNFMLGIGRVKHPQWCKFCVKPSNDYDKEEQANLDAAAKQNMKEEEKEDKVRDGQDDISAGDVKHSKSAKTKQGKVAKIV